MLAVNRELGVFSTGKSLLQQKPRRLQFRLDTTSEQTLHLFKISILNFFLFLFVLCIAALTLFCTSYFVFSPSLSYMHTYAFHLHMRTSIARFSICLFCVNLLLTLLCALTVTCFLSRLFDASFSDFFSFPFLSLFEQDLQSAPCQRVVLLFLYLHSLHGHHNLLLTGYPIISHH